MERYRNGRVARAGAYRAGRKDGRWTTFHEGGGEAEVATWSDGILDGPFVERHRNGKKAREGGYAAVQSTRPLSLAYGLTDSPAGLAAPTISMSHLSASSSSTQRA